MDEYGVYVDLNAIDFRHLLYLSDKAISERKERAQKAKAANTNLPKPRARKRSR